MSEKMTFRAKEVTLRSLHSLDIEVTVELENYDQIVKNLIDDGEIREDAQGDSEGLIEKEDYSDVMDALEDEHGWLIDDILDRLHRSFESDFDEFVSKNYSLKDDD